jgi:hypothetical protein
MLMRNSLYTLVLLALALPGSVSAEPRALPVADQFKVNEAIRQGVAYLRNTQGPNGSWTDQKDHSVGYAALPGLTLLQCGMKAGDSSVQRAASHVLASAGELESTYDLALAILFLDQVSALDDRVLERAELALINRQYIEGFALRLMAGQKADGGWLYSCPKLTTKEHKQLLAALKQKQPNLRRLEEKVRIMPVLKDPAKLIKAVKDSTPPADKPSDQSDNSNTNFAVLALWVAQRQGVPVERSLKLAARRFRNSQNADGGWGYKYRHAGGEPESAPMICSGLVALAIDQGVEDATGRRATRVAVANRQAAATVGFPGLLSHFILARALYRVETAEVAVRKRLEDPVVRKGFDALNKHVGMPAGRMEKIDLGNLYFLWAVERAAILYDVETIADKDWYRWGAEMIVANQKADGHWEKKDGYAGATPVIDTSFALLFLKQANLAEDLTAKLRAAAKKPEEKAAAAAVKPPRPVDSKPAAVFVAPPAPKSLVKEQPVAQAEKEAGRPAPRAVGTVPSAPAEPARLPASAPAARVPALLIWGGVGLGLALVGGAAVLVFLGLQGRGESSAPAERPRRSRAESAAARPVNGSGKKGSSPKNRRPSR